MFKKLLHSKRLPAFSLIEMLAVIVIVAIGLVGTAQLVVQSLQAQTINRSTIVAYQLAQEGVELIRYVRDTNWLKGFAWDQGLAPGIYCIDYKNPTPRLVENESLCRLHFTDEDWYYSPDIAFTTDPPSQFTRAIIIEPASNPTFASSSMMVLVSIEWSDRNRDFNYLMSTELFDWY